MEALRAVPVSSFNGGTGGPTSPEPRRMNPDVVEPEDHERASPRGGQELHRRFEHRHARALRSDERVREIEHGILRLSWRASLVLGALMLALSPVVDRVLRLDSLTTAVVMALTAVPMTMLGGQLGILQGERRWYPLAVVYIANGVPRLLIGVALMTWRPQGVVTRSLLRRLLGYLRPHLPLTALALLFLLIGAGLTLVGPRLTQHALDVAIPAGDTGLLATLALVFLAALLLEFAADYAQALITTTIGQRVMLALRLRLFTHLQRLSIPYFDRHPVGRLMTRVTSDVETLNELFSSGLVTVFGDLFALVAIMAMMLATI